MRRARAAVTIGALFLGGTHYCTAGVVHSGRGDKLLTAAHCLRDGEGGGYFAGVTFAPGYRDGVAPLGFREVGDELVAPGWTTTADPDSTSASPPPTRPARPARSRRSRARAGPAAGPG